MKKKIIIVCLLTIFLAGCGEQKKNKNEQSIETENQIPQPLQESINEITTKPMNQEIYEDISILPEEIHDIIFHKGTFFEVEQQKKFTKDSYKVQVDENEWEDLEWKSYIVYDVDADGENELIVIIEKTPSKPFVEVFDKQEDGVYAYSFPYRGFKDIYTDGVVHGSSGADAGCYRTMKFDKNKYEETIIAESTSEKSKDGDYISVWYIENKKVSEEEYYEFMSNYNSEEIPWSSRPLDVVIKE